MISHELIAATVWALEPEDPELFYQWLEGDGYKIQIACLTNPRLARQRDGSYAISPHGTFSAGRWVVNLAEPVWSDPQHERDFRIRVKRDARSYLWSGALMVKFESADELVETVYAWIKEFS
jgi:hypothetical protein